MNTFEIISALHNEDIQNKTANVGVCTFITDMRNTQSGDLITIGTPTGTMQKIVNDEMLPVLVLVNREEFKKLKAGNTPEANITT